MMETYDWTCLADELGISVNDLEVQGLKQKVDRKNLWNDDYEQDKNKGIAELEIKSYVTESSLKEELIKHKLKDRLYQLSGLGSIDNKQEQIRTIVEYVQKFIMDSPHRYSTVFEKLLEIDDRELFCRALAENIDQLWY